MRRRNGAGPSKGPAQRPRDACVSSASCLGQHSRAAARHRCGICNFDNPPGSTGNRPHRRYPCAGSPSLLLEMRTPSNEAVPSRVCAALCRRFWDRTGKRRGSVHHQLCTLTLSAAALMMIRDHLLMASLSTYIVTAAARASAVTIPSDNRHALLAVHAPHGGRVAQGAHSSRS